MKNIITVLVLTISFFSVSQKIEKPPRKAESTIKTDVQCGDCEGRIEGKLNYTKGIKFAEVNVKNDEILVRYNPRKISLKEVENLISQLGYDANSTKANKAKQLELPKCCQPGGHD